MSSPYEKRRQNPENVAKDRERARRLRAQKKLARPVESLARKWAAERTAAAAGKAGLKRPAAHA